jgi:SAM-dependent methyltransferase
MNLDYASDAQSAAFEKDHWWVRSRFGLIDRVLERLDPAASLAVLEIGCGTGINLDYLEARCGGRLTRLVGVDPEAKPERAGRREVQRDIPSGESFDLILAMDVIEHVDRPVELLASLYAQLKPSGRLLTTVPAFSWLWTTHDQHSHHRKRYSRHELVSELEAAQFIVGESFFLFGTLFPFFVIQRLGLKWRPDCDARTFQVVSPRLNRLLYAVTTWEMRTWMARNRWFGSSIVAIARTSEN